MLQTTIQKNVTMVRRLTSCTIKTSPWSSLATTTTNMTCYDPTNTSRKKYYSSSATDAMAIRTGMNTEQRQRFYELGYVDDRALLNFDNLHDMQARACQVFATKNLFSTYSSETKQFEWMTFTECTYFYKKFVVAIVSSLILSCR
jgi:hypothetical protein